MAYPSFLPLPIRDSYSAGPTQPFQRTLMDDGQCSQVRKWSSVPMGYTLNWNFSYKQAQLFEAWLEYDGGRGIGPLQIPVADKLVNCKPVTGIPMYRLNGNTWNVTMDVIEYRHVPTLSVKPTSLPVWPAGLPGFERAEFQYSKADAMLVSDFDSGPSESRVRFRDRAFRNNAKIILDLTQRNAFWDFYTNTLQGGVSWFYAEFSNSKSQDRRRVRLIEPPKESPTGGWFTVTLAIETINAPILTIEEYRSNFTLINDYVEAGYVELGYVGYYVA